MCSSVHLYGCSCRTHSSVGVFRGTEAGCLLEFHCTHFWLPFLSVSQSSSLLPVVQHLLVWDWLLIGCCRYNRCMPESGFNGDRYSLQGSYSKSLWLEGCSLISQKTTVVLKTPSSAYPVCIYPSSTPLYLSISNKQSALTSKSHGLR